MLKKILLLVCAIVVAIPILKAQYEPSILNAREDVLSRRSAWVDSIYNSLTLEERIGQLFIYTFPNQYNKKNIAHIKTIIDKYKIGGILFSGGEVSDQVKLTNLAQSETNVPLLITLDGEWGLSMRLKDTPKFPRNMVLGSITDESLLYAYGKEVGRQCRLMGIHVNFAPVADVNINPNNPVINTRSFGQVPQNVSEKVIAYSKGLESQNVLSVSKHFPGHGDTNVDSHKSLPRLLFDRARLDSIELVPFRELIKSNLGGVMVGHLNIPALDPEDNIPSSLSKPIVSDLLQKELGFEGLVFTDALEMKGVSNHNDVCLKAILAGNDLLLVPRNLKGEMISILNAISDGSLPLSVIEEKCKKILTYKYALHVDKSQVKLSGLIHELNSVETENLINRLESAAVSCFKSDNDILPFTDSFKKIACLYVGDLANYKTLFDGLDGIYQTDKIHVPSDLSVSSRSALKKQIEGYDRVLICLNSGNAEKLNAFFSKLDADAPIGYLFFMSGDKLYPLEPSIQKADLAILAHSTSNAAQQKVLKILLGQEKSEGELSVAIGDSFPAGTNWKKKIIKTKTIVAKDLGINEVVLNRIDTIVDEAIKGKAFPGCQIVILKNGMPVYEKAFGTFSGQGSKEVSLDDLYDLASLSKTTGTLLAVMKLYDRGLISLTDYISDYLPQLKGTDKSKITIEELLFHESGMAAGLSVYNFIIDSKSYKGPLFRAYKDNLHKIQLARRTWANPNYKFISGVASTKLDSLHTIQIADRLWFESSLKDTILSKIIEQPLLAKRYRYSCLGFILLQNMVENIVQEPMDKYLDYTFFRPMGLRDICYNPLKNYDKSNIVPSTDDKFFRKEILQGFVHDELAALQGGVSGNAGQFGTAKAVATIYQFLLDGGFYNGKRILSESTCNLFITKKSKTSRRGLGFDKPNPDINGASACLKKAPIETFGHTGFTGSCAWADPINQLVFVLTCNRTYPSQYPNKLAELDVRDRIQQTIYDSL